MPPGRWIAALVLVPLAGGCARALPDPREAAQAYAEALEKGDAEAIYAMMTERSRRELHVDDVRKLLSEAREELVAQAKAASDPGAMLKATAQVRYADGEEATLDLENGEFKVSSADALPALARTPEQALMQLRRVLARRSYAGLTRVLSPSARRALENDLRSLVEGLAHPEGLEIDVQGETASVRVEGGHIVKLRRERGIWYVEDFD